jgi:hypothetical protein
MSTTSFALRPSLGTVAVDLVLRGQDSSGDLPLMVELAVKSDPANIPRTLPSMHVHRRTDNSLTCRKTPL